MKKSEVAALLSAIVTAYPASRVELNADTVSLWTEMLSDIDAAEATLAVKALIATEHYPPSIADVREAVRKTRSEARGDLTPGEAWARVFGAIRRFGYIHPDEAREMLGEDLWNVVKQVGGWTDICLSEHAEVISAQFERRYKSMQDAQRWRETVPLPIQQAVKALADGKRLALEGGKP